MNDILVKMESKRGYYTITYLQAKNKEEYKTNKREIGYYCIQKDEVNDNKEFEMLIKNYYINFLSNKDLVFVRN